MTCATAQSSSPAHSASSSRPWFTWTKTTDQIVEKVQRGRVTLNAITS